MNIELYFKKVFTVAYRLTADREIAEEMAELAITNTVSQCEDYKVTASLLQLTILELFKIFLKMSLSQCHDDLMIQNSLLRLKPVNRVLVVWKDVLGYPISSNIPIADYTYEELVVELLRGRRELKDLINMN